MKKIILTSAALLALAAASQAQTVVQQVGQQQAANPNSFGLNQTGLIQQVQNATPALNGVNYGNYAITFQGTPQNNGANTLTITQNDGSQGNRAGISQSGGPGLTATIQQNGGPNGLSGGATSTSATQNARGEDGNFAGVSQTGSNSTATITQSNNSRRNSAETYQNGTNNFATTTQSNNSVSNSGFIFQGFSGQNLIASSVSSATAVINQGKNDAADLSAGAALPEAVRSTAVITQTASQVNAEIYQGGVTGFGAGQAGRADGASAVINQAAINTAAFIFQGTSSGEALGSRTTINQTGANTVAFVTQGSGATGSDQASTASITQIGAGTSFPLAFISQGVDAASESNQASIMQTASNVDGVVLITQGSGLGGSYSNGDRATVVQGGNANTAIVNQNSTDLVAVGQSNGRGNTAMLTQGTGVISSFGAIDQGLVSVGGVVLQVSRNTATLSQSAGVNLRARISQGLVGTPQDAQGSVLVLPLSLDGAAVVLTGRISNDNTASISQSSGDNHSANLFQTGRFNTATISQSVGSNAQGLIVQTANSERSLGLINQSSGGTNNSATIYQFSGSNADGVGQYGNLAVINQLVGSNNIAFLQQGRPGSASSSNDNQASVSQNGSSNQARFLQLGNNNFLSLVQNGNNNQLLNGAGSAGSFGSQVGYNNRLTLVQNGGTVGLTFNYTQVGNNNTQVVNQNLNP